MSLLETIHKDFTVAMKERREAELSTLRLLRSALKNKQIELIHELSEDEAVAVIKSQIKQLKDSIDSFQSAGRADLSEKAQVELAVLLRYLPAQLSETDLASTVKEALASSGISQKQDMGKAMGVAMKAVAGRADGNRVKAAVESLLS